MTPNTWFNKAFRAVAEVSLRSGASAWGSLLKSTADRRGRVIGCVVEVDRRGDAVVVVAVAAAAVWSAPTRREAH